MDRAIIFDQALGWWLRQPNDQGHAYRANVRGIFYGHRGSVVGADLRKVKPSTRVELSRPQSFIADGGTANDKLPGLARGCPGCHGTALRLHSELAEEQIACLGCGAMYELRAFGAYPLVSWGLRLEGRWGKGDEERIAKLGPAMISAKGAQASKAAIALAYRSQPVAFAADVIDDRGLGHLGPQPHLQALRVWYTKITDSALSTIAGCTTLRRLVLGNNAGITDTGIELLATLAELSELNIEQTALGDVGLAALAKIPSLELLWIARTRITDNGLATLRAHPSLRWINVGSNSTITDRGVEHLATIPNLESASVYGTKVTAAAKRKHAFLQ